MGATRGGGVVDLPSAPNATEIPDDDCCGVTDGGCISFWGAGCGFFLAARFASFARTAAATLDVPGGVGATWATGPSVIASISRSAFLSDILMDVWRLAIISFWRCEIVTDSAPN